MIEKVIYQNAIKRSGRERIQFVEAVCGLSDELRENVDSLILTHELNTGDCGGDTISLVLRRHESRRHESERVSNRMETVVSSLG